MAGSSYWQACNRRKLTICGRYKNMRKNTRSNFSQMIKKNVRVDSNALVCDEQLIQVQTACRLSCSDRVENGCINQRVDTFLSNLTKAAIS